MDGSHCGVYGNSCEALTGSPKCARYNVVARITNSQPLPGKWTKENFPAAIGSMNQRIADKTFPILQEILPAEPRTSPLSQPAFRSQECVPRVRKRDFSPSRLGKVWTIINLLLAFLTQHHRRELWPSPRFLEMR